MENLKTGIERIGQPYVDDPIFVAPRSDLLSPLGMAISAAFNDGAPDIPPRLVVGHERVKLNWVRPSHTVTKFKKR